MAGTITIITRTLTNADTVDFFHMDQDVRTIASPTFAGLTLSGKNFACIRYDRNRGS